MSSKISVLRTPLHREFLEAEFQDPVTRKVFVAGDRVRLCATCLSPFLDQSWKAIGSSHCGQFATVGVEALNIALDTPETPRTEDPDTATNAENAAPSITDNSTHGPGLRPPPLKLKEVPITLNKI